MKNFLLGIGITIFIVAMVVGAYFLGSQQNNSPIIPSPTLTPIEEPTVTPVPMLAVSDQDLIRKALFAENGWPDDETIKVVVKTNNGKYASGSVNGSGGGGYFFAAKVGGEWKIVADGNGTISCETLDSYPDYPKSLIPECFNQATGKIIKR